MMTVASAVQSDEMELWEKERQEIIRRQRLAVDKELEQEYARMKEEVDRECSESMERATGEIENELTKCRNEWAEEQQRAMYKALEAFLRQHHHQQTDEFAREELQELLRLSMSEVQNILSQAHEAQWRWYGALTDALEGFASNLERTCRGGADMLKDVHRLEQQEGGCIERPGGGVNEIAELIPSRESINIRSDGHSRRVARLVKEISDHTDEARKRLGAERVDLSKKVVSIVGERAKRGSPEVTESNWSNQALTNAFQDVQDKRKQLLRVTSLKKSMDPVVLRSNGLQKSERDTAADRIQLCFPDIEQTASAVVGSAMNGSKSSVIEQLIREKAAGGTQAGDILATVDEAFERYREKTKSESDAAHEQLAQCIGTLVSEHNNLLCGEGTIQKSLIDAIEQALELLAKIDPKLTTRITEAIFSGYDYLEELPPSLAGYLEELASRMEVHDLEEDLALARENSSKSVDGRRHMLQVERRLQLAQREIKRKFAARAELFHRHV